MADACYKDDAGEAEDDVVTDPEASRAHVKRLFIRNKCSGLETQALTAAATKSGAVGVQDFASTGKAGKLAKNIHRDLMRKMLKGNKMPDLYWAQIPCSDPKTGEKKTMAWLPFLLVHEFLVLLAKTTSMDELVCFPEGSGLQEFQCFQEQAHRQEPSHSHWPSWRWRGPQAEGHSGGLHLEFSNPA